MRSCKGEVLRLRTGCIALVTVLVFVTATGAGADPRRGGRRREGGPPHRMLLDAPEEKSASFSKSERADSSKNVLTTSAVLPQDLYSGNALRVLKRIHTDTLDPQSPNDPDQLRNRRAAPRAATVQGVATMQRLFETSELKPLYDQARRYLKDVQDQFKVGVYETDKGMEVSQSPTKGKRMLELDLGLDPFQGMSPLIRLGEAARLRYDPFSKRTLLEYSIDF